MTREPRSRKFILRLGRRAALGGATALAVTRRAHAAPTPNLDEDLRNLRLIDASEAGRRFTLIVPKYLAPDRRLPLVIFLHGLGETGDPRAGAYAWIERYGLGSAWQRLKDAPHVPLAPTSRRGEWTPERLAEINAELTTQAFRGFIMACPSMPNPRGAAEVTDYARWVEDKLVPRVRREAPVEIDAARTMLCGVSLGGWVSLEILVRAPHLFGGWAGVQTAINTAAATRFADKLAAGWRGAPRPTLVLTSTQDHWRASSEALAKALASRGMKSDYRVIPGPHDQPWLREAGTVETLAWLDRALRS